MKNNYLLTISFLLFIIFQTYAQQDSDWDGMPDDWEIEFGLDPNDKKDAYHDTDGDHVINIYEYQMESNPNDKTEPSHVVFDRTTTLDDFIKSVPDKNVIRIPEGMYTENMFIGGISDSHIMIQGGWSSDLQEYDPERYKTIFDQEDNLITYVSILNKRTIIIDGLHIENCKDSYYGALHFSNSSSDGIAINISNCTIINNMGFSALSISLGGKGNSSLYIINNIVKGNKEFGVKILSDKSSSSTVHIANNTIVKNRISDYGEGLRILATEESSISFELKNNIIYNNNDHDLKLGGNCIGEGSNNIISTLEFIGGEYESENNIDAVPEFEDELIDNFSPLANGNLIDMGIDVGIPFVGSAPDLGAIESDFSPNSINEAFTHKFILYPNPANSKVHIDSEIDIIKLSVFDLTGKEIHTTTNRDIDIKSWLPGLYRIKIFTENGSKYKKLIKL